MRGVLRVASGTALRLGVREWRQKKTRMTKEEEKKRSKMIGERILVGLSFFQAFAMEKDRSQQFPLRQDLDWTREKFINIYIQRSPAANAEYKYIDRETETCFLKSDKCFTAFYLFIYIVRFLPCF